MFIYEGIGGLVLCLAAAVLAIYFYGRNQRDIGYEEGRADQYNAIGELAEMAEMADLYPALEPAGAYPGRHARTQPRQEAAAALPAPDDPPATPGPENRLPRPPWYTELRPPAPAPALTGAADTGTMPRIRLAAATTGAIRAVGDEIVARIQRGDFAS